MYLVICSITALMLSAWSAVPAQAETYRWTDEAGVIHFADDQDRIPSRYRQKATVVKGDAPVNIMPGTRAPGRAAAEEKAVDADRGPAAHGMNKAGKGSRKEKRGHKEAPAPTTPARDAQNRAEERIRQDRQTIDDAQLPARRAQDQAEHQIRKAREKTMGH
jgi:hypothetical protein